MPPDTDWEGRYQQGDTPWDKRAPHPALLEYLRARPLEGRVLVVGCGLGHDVRAIAAAGTRAVAAATTTGIDIAPSALRHAQSFPRMRDEHYELADLFALPPHLRNRFDIVFEHTCFCAIDPSARPAYVRGVLDALTPQGRLFAIFYLDPGGDPNEGPPFGVAVPELDALFSPHFDLLEQFVPAVTYPGRENRELLRLLQRKPA